MTLAHELQRRSSYVGRRYIAAMGLRLLNYTRSGLGREKWRRGGLSWLAVATTEDIASSFCLRSLDGSDCQMQSLRIEEQVSLCLYFCAEENLRTTIYSNWHYMRNMHSLYLFFLTKVLLSRWQHHRESVWTIRSHLPLKWGRSNLLPNCFYHMINSPS